MANKSVPVALFAYNRTGHFRQTIDALAKNHLASESPVYLFIDGPKNEYDKLAGLKIRAIASEYEKQFASIELIVSDSNKGLAGSIVGGVTKMLELHEAIIVLEDDLVTAPYFLKYMNDGVNLYENHPLVASIHGYIYPVEKTLPETFFLRGADCWGWATWRSAWNKYNPNGKYLLQELKNRNLISRFDLDGAADNSRMLEDQINGKNDSWAIRWHASMFLENMFTLYPKTSLVKNNGTKYGTHSNFDALNLGKKFIEKKYKPIIKKQAKEDDFAVQQIEFFFKKNYLFRIKEFLKKFYNQK